MFVSAQHIAKCNVSVNNPEEKCARRHTLVPPVAASVHYSIHRRWDGDFLTACDLIKCGVLGRLVEFESHFDRYRPALKSSWKEDAELPGAGVIYDLGEISSSS